MARNVDRDRVVGDRLRVAATPWQRMRGLLGHPALGPGEGLVIDPCNGIHTVGMRYPIDVIFLTAHGVVLRCEHALPPGRFVPWVWRAHRLIELPPGTLDATMTTAGDRLVFQEAGL